MCSLCFVIVLIIYLSVCMPVCLNNNGNVDNQNVIFLCFIEEGCTSIFLCFFLFVCLVISVVYYCYGIVLIVLFV